MRRSRYRQDARGSGGGGRGYEAAVRRLLFLALAGVEPRRSGVDGEHGSNSIEVSVVAETIFFNVNLHAETVDEKGEELLVTASQFCVKMNEALGGFVAAGVVAAGGCVLVVAAVIVTVRIFYRIFVQPLGNFR